MAPFASGEITSMPQNTLSQHKARHFRSLGHKLKPVIIIAGKGVNENITLEIDRALNDHELIKISLKVGDRALKQSMVEKICTDHKASLVQLTGNIALLYRAAEKPNPKLSNLMRPL